MATDEAEGNNFLAELKNVLQRFNKGRKPQHGGDKGGAADSGEAEGKVVRNGSCIGAELRVTDRESEKISDVTDPAGGTSPGLTPGRASQSRHTSGSPSKGRPILSLSLAPSLNSLTDSSDTEPRHEGTLRTTGSGRSRGHSEWRTTNKTPMKEFFPRSPQLMTVPIPLSPTLRDETEYPPKSPPKTVFQHYPKSPKTPDIQQSSRSTLEPDGSPKFNTRFNFSNSETNLPSRTRNGSSGFEDSDLKKPRSDSLPKIPSAPMKTPEPREKGGIVLVKQDLYNELNNVLRRRNEKGHHTNVLDFEKLKTGKSVVYYGRGGQGLGDDSQPQTPMSSRSDICQGERHMDSSFEIRHGRGSKTVDNIRRKRTGTASSAEDDSIANESPNEKTKVESLVNHLHDSHDSYQPQSPRDVMSDNINEISQGMCYGSTGDFQNIVDELNLRYRRENKGTGDEPKMGRHHDLLPRSVNTYDESSDVGYPDNGIDGDTMEPHLGPDGRAAMATAADDSRDLVNQDECQCGGHLLLSVCPTDNFPSDEIDGYTGLPLRTDADYRLKSQPLPQAADADSGYTARLPPLPRITGVLQCHSDSCKGGSDIRRNSASQTKLKKATSAPCSSQSPCRKPTPLRNGGVGSKCPGSLYIHDVSSSEECTDFSYSASDNEAALGKVSTTFIPRESAAKKQLPYRGSSLGVGSDGSLTTVTSCDNSGTEAGVKRQRSYRAPFTNGATGGHSSPGHMKASSWHSLMFVTGADTWIHHYNADQPDTEDSVNNNSGNDGIQGSMPELDSDPSAFQKKDRKMGGSSGRFKQKLSDGVPYTCKDSTHGGKPVRGGSHLPTKIAHKKKWGNEDSINLRKAYATYPPPRWSRASGLSKDDDVIATLMITHAGDRLPSDSEDKKKKKADSRPSCISANVTVPLPTSFHQHGNDVGHHLIRHPLNPTGDSCLEPDYDLQQMESDFTLNPMDLCDDHLLDDNHDSCHVCLGLAEESPHGVHHDLDTEDQNEGSNEYETECSTEADSRGRYPSLDDDHVHFSKHLALDKETHKYMLYHTWSSSAAKKAHDRLRTHPWNIRRSMAHIEEDSDSSAYLAKQWCKSSDDLYGRSSARAQLLRQSDSYSSDDATLAVEKQAARFNALEKMGGGKHERSYSIANSIQSMCTYIMDSYDHSSDGDTESLYQDYDAYEKSLIQYVKTEDLSQINDDIRSLYWQQLDTISLGALHIQQRSMLHKFICCFVCNRRFHKRSRNKTNKRCPLTQNIVDGGSVAVFGDGLSRGLESKPATFYVEPQGKRGDLWVQVDGPNSIAKCNIEPDAAGRYVVTYVPVECGIYIIQIKWNNRVVPGSPFQPKITDPNRVQVVGGWQNLLDAHNKMVLTVNEMKRIEFNTAGAGEGILTAELRGPSGVVPCEIEQPSKHRYIVSFMPRTEGEHYLSLWWSEVALARSPIVGYAHGAQASINSDKVILTGHGLQTAQANMEAEFVIDGTEAGPGKPEVTLTGVKEDIMVNVAPLAGRANCYRCTYLPRLPGGYLLNITWSDRQVRGSPFKVSVNASSDASKVQCSGEGIKVGIIGKEIKSVIDTRRAGPGELEAHCMGPSKVAYCELFDHHDGTFTLNIKPQEAGKHILQIKYGGEHVPGSPYTLRVSGAPDASKVRVSGPGIEHGILATYQSRFMVETRGAGAGQLTVRIRGPKGSFRVEMSRESQRDRTIMCRYDPTEVGDYIINVKWSGDHVPGSPFRVQIFDTQQELEHFLGSDPGHGLNTSANRSWESRNFDM